MIYIRLLFLTVYLSLFCSSVVEGATPTIVPADIQKAEVQWTVCPSSQAKLIQIIRDINRESKGAIFAKKWTTSYYDTANLELFGADSIVFRERKSSSEYETSFKLNLTTEEYEGHRDAGRLQGLVCELDVYEARSKVGCRLKNSARYAQDKFSDQQKQLLRNFSDVAFSNLRKFGGLETTSFEFDLFNSFDSFVVVVVEVMRMNPKTLWIEVSTRVLAQKKSQIIELINKTNNKMLLWFKEQGVNLCHPRIGKTETILRANKTKVGS